MSYTKEQEEIVTRVLANQPHQYYEILSVSKTSSDGDIKKSYRKLAIKLHPDKNPHPRASEAFKYINKAWGVLGDPSKKRIYDQTGADPDLRFAGVSGQSSGGGSSAFRATPGFQGGFDGQFQDDIFNMFFGGGARPGSTFTFGGNGFTFQSFGADGFDPFTGARRQTRRPQQQQRQEEPSMFDTLRQLAPVLIILLATLLSSLFSGEDTPEYLFTKTSKYPVQRETPRLHIPFYVGEKFAVHKSDNKLRNFDHKVENLYVQDRRAKCSREQVAKNNLMEDAQGWFYTDQRKMEAAENMPMPHCQELRDLGLL